MHVSSEIESASDARKARRTNMFLAAVLLAGGASYQVKIRDMSMMGANIETPLLPLVGSIVNLVRGSLTVRGTVAWSTDQRCGLDFEESVCVQDWLSNRGNKEQHRLDHVIDVLKAGAIPLETPAISETITTGEIADGLWHIAALLEALEDALAEDFETVARHGVRLQNLDIARQYLAALAAIPIESLRPSALAAARLRELRTSCAVAFRRE